MGLFESSTSIFARARMLESKGEPYTLKRVNQTFTLVNDFFGIKKSRNNYLSGKELGFINKTKSYIKRSFDPSKFMDPIDPYDINYIGVNKDFCKNNIGFIENIVEVDINEAYWRLAYITDLISESIYESGKKGGEVSKYARLVALGSLAKKEYIYKYQGKALRYKGVTVDPLENIWLTICKMLDDEMQVATKIAGKDFLHYWVDGIYLINPSKKVVENIKNHFLNRNYKVKTNNHSATITDQQIIIHKDKKMDDENRKPFFIPKKERKKSRRPVLNATEEIKKIDQLLK